MKHALRMIVFNTSVTVAVWTICYLIATFTIWEWKNPFQWIIDMPTYYDFERFAILFGWLIYEAIVISVAYNVTYRKE